MRETQLNSEVTARILFHWRQTVCNPHSFQEPRATLSEIQSNFLSPRFLAITLDLVS